MDVTKRLVGSVLALGLLASGCGIGSLVPGAIDPACRTHADPADCQAALDVAIGELGFEGYTIDVQPITCAGGQCTTWVSALPSVGEDCLPDYEVEVTRAAIGRHWTVESASHGDPPCAFEP